MKAKWAWHTVLLLPLCASAGNQAPTAQTAAAVPITSEPHHHLSLQNDYVKVYEVEVAPHQSTLLHQHDRDYVYITIGDAQVTSAIPGRQEVHLKLADGEAHRLARIQDRRDTRDPDPRQAAPESGPARFALGAVDRGAG